MEIELCMQTKISSLMAMHSKEQHPSSRNIQGNIEILQEKAPAHMNNIGGTENIGGVLLISD